MTELELREKILDLQASLENVIASGEAEQRELTEEESNQMVDLRSQIDEAKAELAKVEEENRKLAEQTNHNQINKNKTMKEIRLFDLVKAVAEGNVSDEQRAYIKGNSIDFRAAIQATAEGMGKENVPTDKAPLELAIRNATVLDKLGVTWFSNAVGDIEIPKYHGSQVFWADSENAEAEHFLSGRGFAGPSENIRRTVTQVERCHVGKMIRPKGDTLRHETALCS